MAKFQIGDVDDALRVARTILRRDPEFWDIRAAATAFLWADGREDEAEAEWSKLCRSGRGFGAASSAEDARADGAAAYAARLFEQQMAQQAAVVSGVIDGDGSRRDGRDAGGGMDAAGRRRPTADDTPCAMYRNVGIVAPRWPPRCTAALDAFLKVRREGRREGLRRGGEDVQVRVGAGWRDGARGERCTRGRVSLLVRCQSRLALRVRARIPPPRNSQS